MKEPKKYHFEWGSLLYDNIGSIHIFKKNDPNPNVILIRGEEKSDIDKQIKKKTKNLFDLNLIQVRYDIINVLLTNNFQLASSANSSNSNASKNSAISDSYDINMDYLNTPFEYSNA